MSSINVLVSRTHCRMPLKQATTQVHCLQMGAGLVPRTSKHMLLKGLGAVALPALDISHLGLAAKSKRARRLACSYQFRKAKPIVAEAGKSEVSGPGSHPHAPLVARSLAAVAAAAALAMAVKHHTVTVQGLVWAGANLTELSLLLVQALRYPSPDNVMELQALGAYMIKTFATSVARALGEWTLLELNQAWAAFEALTVAVSSRLLTGWLCVGQALAGGVHCAHSKATALLSGSTWPVAAWALQIVDFVVLVALWNPFTVPAAALFTVTKVICSWTLSTVETACALLYITPTLATVLLILLGLALRRLMPYARVCRMHTLSERLYHAALAGSPPSPLRDTGKDAKASLQAAEAVVGAEGTIPSNHEQEGAGEDLVAGMRAEVDRVMAQMQSALQGGGAGKEADAAATTTNESKTAAIGGFNTKQEYQGKRAVASTTPRVHQPLANPGRPLDGGVAGVAKNMAKDSDKTFLIESRDPKPASTSRTAASSEDDFVGNKSADASSGAAAADTSQAEGEMLQSFEERKKSDAKDNQKFVVLDESPLFRAAARPITNKSNDPTSPGSPKAAVPGPVEANNSRPAPMDDGLAEDWAGAFSSSSSASDEKSGNDEDNASGQKAASLPLSKSELPLPSQEVPEPPKPAIIRPRSLMSEPSNAEGSTAVQPDDTKSYTGSAKTHKTRHSDDAGSENASVQKATRKAQGQGKQSDKLTDLTDTLELGGLLLSLPAKALSKSLKQQKEAQALRKVERDAQETPPLDAPQPAKPPVPRTSASQTLLKSNHTPGDDKADKGLLELVPENMLSTLEVVSGLGGGGLKSVRAKDGADEEPVARKRARSIWEALGASPAEKGEGGTTRKWKPPVR